MAVMTRALRPVWCLWSSSCEEIMAAAQQQAAQGSRVGHWCDEVVLNCRHHPGTTMDSCRVPGTAAQPCTCTIHADQGCILP